MKKILILLVMTLSMISCESNLDETTKFSEVYIVALESFITLDEGLNSGMAYIAINVDTLTEATEDDITVIINYFSKYEVEVIDESFETLKEKGLVKDKSNLEGILLEIDTIEVVSDRKIIVEGSKHRSGLGAIGVQSIIIKKDGKWILESSFINWIS